MDFKLKNNIGNSYIWGPAESETLVFSYVRNKSLLLSMWESAEGRVDDRVS